jgi:hypothetical protein
VLAEVKLTIAPTGATLTVMKGDKVIDEELWSFGRKIGSSEAADAAKAVFDDAYDALNWMVNGDE